MKAIWDGRAGYNQICGEVFKGREIEITKEQFKRLGGQVKLPVKKEAKK